MARKQNSGQSTPFLGGEDRPDVHSLLDKPIRDLTPRQLADLFAALGMPSGPVSATRDAVVGDVPPEEDFPSDPRAWDQMFGREQILAELVAAGASLDVISGMEIDDLVEEAKKYNISAATTAQLGTLKQIFDKARRDKPVIDKAIRDGKAAADKFIRDGKPTVDKVLKDGKTWVDKQLKDKGALKDASDAKQIKDLFEGGVVTPVGDQPTVEDLAEQVEAMRAQFEAISQTIDQIQASQG